MSLGIVIKGPEGLVLAAESRITLTADTPNNETIVVNFDNATKLLSFSKPNYAVGVVTYGLAALGLRAAHSFIPEFESHLNEKHGNNRLTIKEFSDELSNFFMKQWSEEMPSPEEYNGPDMTFVIAGFDENAPYGKVFLIDIPNSPEPKEQHINDGAFGITWGGQREFVDRLLLGSDPRFLDSLEKNGVDPKLINNLVNLTRMQIPLEAMALQDCVDLALFFVRTTINAQNLSVGIRGCGGAIDVATITRDGLKFVQKKEISGEK